MRNISDILKDTADKLRRSTDSEGNTPKSIHQVPFFCNSLRQEAHIKRCA